MCLSNKNVFKLTVNIIRIIKRFIAIPDNSKRYGNARLISHIAKVLLLAVDGVRQKVSINLTHATFNIELANKTNGNSLGNVVHSY